MKVPKRDQFLPDAGIDEPGTLHKKEANARAGDRPPAYMARRDGGPVQAMGRSLNRAATTACDWPAGAEGGPGRPYDTRRPGPARRPAGERPAGLKGDPVAGPQAQGLGPGLWTGKPAAGHVPGRYGVRYVPRTMQELPHGAGPGRTRPKPRHPRAAPGEERRRWSRPVPPRAPPLARRRPCRAARRTACCRLPDRGISRSTHSRRRGAWTSRPRVSRPHRVSFLQCRPRASASTRPHGALCCGRWWAASRSRPPRPRSGGTACAPRGLHPRDHVAAAASSQRQARVRQDAPFPTRAARTR